MKRYKHVKVRVREVLFFFGTGSRIVAIATPF